MRTIICPERGRLEYSDTAEPKQQSGEAILRVTHVGVCGTDLHAFEGTQPFFSYPRILGHELAAVVEVPGDSGRFSVGEAVTFVPYFSCGKCIACRTGKPNCCVRLAVYGVHIDGGMRNYISIPETSLVAADGLTGESLALIEPLSIGAHGVERAMISPGEHVLVIGAGPIGLGAMQFAAMAGGVVIAMDINIERLAFCRDVLKVPHVVNARDTNLSEQLAGITEGDMASVVIDATGNLGAINNAFQYMAHGGRFVLIGLQKNQISISHPEFHKREGTLMSSRNATRKDFEYVISCIRNKRVDPLSYITHRVKFESVVDQFPSWLNPDAGVIKAMISL